MYTRFIEARLTEALSDTPVVLLTGPRRSGKTTLAKTMGADGRAYLTLDDQTILEAARSDPIAFIRGLDRAIIDEVQRVTAQTAQRLDHQGKSQSEAKGPDRCERSGGGCIVG